MIKTILAIILCFTGSLSLLAQSNNDNEMAMLYYQNGDYQKAAVLLEKIVFKTKHERAVIFILCDFSAHCKIPPGV